MVIKVSNFEWILNVKINLTPLDLVFLDFKFLLIGYVLTTLSAITLTLTLTLMTVTFLFLFYHVSYYCNYVEPVWCISCNFEWYDYTLYLDCMYWHILHPVGCLNPGEDLMNEKINEMKRNYLSNKVL
jgi:hypothetical protein